MRDSKHWRWVAAALAGLGLSGAAAAGCSNEAPLLVGDSVLIVTGDDGSTGSGVVVAPNRVLTVAHAVRGGSRLSVTVAHRSVPAHTLAFDIEHDLALLAVDTDDSPSLPLLDRALVAGELIWVAGHRVDGAMERAQQLGYGRVIGPWQGTLRISALVEAGQSGGALIACEGARLMLGGTLSGFGALRGQHGSVRLPDFSLAVPNDVLRTFLAEAGIGDQLRAAQR